MSLFGVVTTINPPSSAMRRLAASIESVARLIVIGDTKGPDSFDLPCADFWSIERQATLSFALAGLLPTRHYARKNLGYLLAIQQGASCIYETDDDNAPLSSWRPRNLRVTARVAPAKDWINVYRWFSDEPIWPRGFPLDQIRPSLQMVPVVASESVVVDAPIQQGLADGSPDVDAIWRLTRDQSIVFQRSTSVWLPEGAFCPFNSQTTWWWPVAYPLLYLPSFCSFRMTDIVRSFVAQRCLWAAGYGVVFHASEVEQERNDHVLMRDFADEIPGYLNNDRICRVLAALALQDGPGLIARNLYICYDALVSNGLHDARELPLIRAFLGDIAGLQNDGSVPAAPAP